MAKEKINPVLREKLFSADLQTALQAITFLKEEGNKLYLPMVFDLLNSNPEPELNKAITALLATVKDQSTVPVFVEALENPRLKPVVKSILTTCWQNGLDFSPYAPVFVKLVIEESWEIAFEAFTVVDNFEFLPEPEVLAKTIDIIDQALPAADDQKDYFLREIKNKFI